jgi:hypothetical protein
MLLRWMFFINLKNNLMKIDQFLDHKDLKKPFHFLELKHFFAFADSINSYCLYDGEQGLGIYVENIELDGGEPYEGFRLLKSVDQVDLINPKLLQDFCIYHALHSNPFDGSITFISSTVITKETFEFHQNEREIKEKQMRAIAEGKPSEIIDELRRLQATPEPTTYNTKAWTAPCLFHKRKHFMFVDTVKNECRCPYGPGKLTLNDLKKM